MSNPKCEWLCPDYPPLKGDVGQSAVNGQLIHYPKVVRDNQDQPITNQSVGLVSFMLFKEPRKLQTGEPVYGFFKLRGNYGTEQTAENKSAEIIKLQDSKFPILVAPVGSWLPITEEKAVCKKMLDVKMKEEDPGLRDEAAREAQNKERQRLRELKEREEELKSKDVYDNPDVIDYYTMKRVTELRIKEYILTEEKKLNDIRGKLDTVRKELFTLEQKHPEFMDTVDENGEVTSSPWVDRYNVERRKTGIPDYVPNAELRKDYQDWKKMYTSKN
jgi:hypothetical protein